MTGGIQENPTTQHIVIRGARQHNLKNIDVSFPRNKLVVITGPSGSGKSSLAFDTIFAEGQRRYVESLSTYARQFIHQLPKPDVDYIEGLSPSISIHQQNVNRNPRSTIGTATEIYDFLRLLYTRVGKPYCSNCGKPILSQTIQEMVDQVLNVPENTKIIVQAPVVRNKRGGFKREILHLKRTGFVRVKIDGKTVDLETDVQLSKSKLHNIDVYVDRLSIRKGIRQRLTESIELALELTNGLVRIVLSDGIDILMSKKLTCIECDVSIPEITPSSFSFNDPKGACSSCGGLGKKLSFDPELIIPDPSRSVRDGAITAWGKVDGAYYQNMVKRLTECHKIDIDISWKDLSEDLQHLILYGGSSKTDTVRRSSAHSNGYPGVIPSLERRRREYEKRKLDDAESYDFVEETYNRFILRSICRTCKGSRLNKEVLSIKIEGKSISDLTGLNLDETQVFLSELTLSSQQIEIAQPILREINSRINCLLDLGLGYLSLARSMTTVSAGESERIRLANQLGSGLVGVLYVLDEPSVGLHARDNARLLKTLTKLRDRGNTVLLVEHDTDSIRTADYIIDMGPAAGSRGGEVTFSGTVQGIVNQPNSITGQYLSGARSIRLPQTRSPISKRTVTVHNATTHNLANITVQFPIGNLICVTGVSGSGKSSLVMHTLLTAARYRVSRNHYYNASHTKITGLEFFDKVVHVDQSPIGRTPRSNPVTYTGIFGLIRELYAGLPESRTRGYTAARFSFNNKGGRCEACRGDGILRVEMHFLPDMYVQCKTCQGQRYNRETLDITYRGKNIAELLSMTIQEAFVFLEVFPKIKRQLSILCSVGLGYLKLGQSATTLSGGEAQRLKLSRELSSRSTGRTLYVLDEPTTGLHLCDIELLVNVLFELVNAGNTVVIIEHNLDVIKLADYIIDMGPEGGSDGGRVIAHGTPEEVSQVDTSYTGRYLRRVLGSYVSSEHLQKLPTSSG